MSGIKIINVLKDDTLPEIMEVFRQAPVGEVIFVLPKNGKVFKKEDHFAAFAAEAAGSGKTLSILAPNPEIAAMARAYKFNVMSSGKTAPSKKAKATLASSPPPADEDKVDTNEDAYQDDVVVPSDERAGVEEADDETSELEGFHIEDEAGPVDLDADGDGETDKPKQGDLEYGDDAELLAAGSKVPLATLAMARTTKAKPKAVVAPVARGIDEVAVHVEREPDMPMPVFEEPVAPAPAPVAAPVRPRPAPAPVDKGDMDYIDAVWRDRVAAQGGVDVAAPVVVPMKGTRTPFWNKLGGHHVSRQMAIGILVVSALLLGTVVWATTGSANIMLTPVSHELNVQLTVQASDVYTTVDSSFNKIPGQLFEANRSATAEAPATGSRDVASKSRGKITIYNEYSSTPQALIATTRFGTPDGKVFRTLQTVTVPGSTVKEGKPVAGTVTVDVIADKPGEAYNAPAGKWVIVAFQEKGDAERTAKIYGVSTEAMSGGASGPSKVVLQADYDKAFASAQQQVRDQLKDAFATQAVGMRVLDEATPVWGDTKATAKADDAADKVSVTLSGTLKTVAFRQEDLDKLLAEVILQKERLVIVPEQLELSFSDVSFKPDVGTLAFSVTVKGPGYEPVDTDVIRSEIKGKGAAQIREYFAQKEGIESATVSLSPFWVRSVPNKDSRITIDVRRIKPEAI